MKRINNLILALAGLFAVACADTFEERYDLAVNTDRYSVTAEAGKLPVTVYCSGAWTAQLTAESAWAHARPHGRQRHHDHPPQLRRQPRTDPFGRGRAARLGA